MCKYVINIIYIAIWWLEMTLPDCQSNQQIHYYDGNEEEKEYKCDLDCWGTFFYAVWNKYFPEIKLPHHHR